MSEAERHAYDEHLDAAMIQNTVLNTAKMEDRMEERRENARNLNQLGVSPEIIERATSLSQEEIAGRL